MTNNPLKLISVVGARPQFIKLAPVHISALSKGISHQIVHTGQHYDSHLSDRIFEDLQLAPPKYNLNVGSSSHTKQTAAMMLGLEEIFDIEKPSGIILYGDTNSTIAGALVAVKSMIPVFHFEAGLRSKNMAMPEEINRIVTDHLSDLLFAPTVNAMLQLETEGLLDRTRLTGDVMVDSIDIAIGQVATEEQLVVEEQFGNEIIVTIHRPENTDSEKNLRNIFMKLKLSNLNFTVLTHPRLRKVLNEFQIFDFGNNIKFSDPLPYSQMIRVLHKCKGLITDSGGLQKEAFIIGSRCLTIRNETEWPETLALGMNTLDANLTLDLDLYFASRSEQPLTKVFGLSGVADRAMDLIIRHPGLQN